MTLSSTKGILNLDKDPVSVQFLLLLYSQTEKEYRITTVLHRDPDNGLREKIRKGHRVEDHHDLRVWLLCYIVLFNIKQIHVTIRNFSFLLKKQISNWIINIKKARRDC
jgi:hypothetical protein